MAIYFLRVKVFSRRNGSRATRAAAYRAGERIRDERTSEVYNHTDRTDVAHAEIVLPTEYAGRVDMEWALNRSTLWNAAEHVGRRKDSRLAREILVYVPPELTPAQRTHLVRTFSRELANRYRNAVDLAVHEPRAHADHRHHHAHLLMTTRQVGPDGLGARTTLDLSGTDRHQRGLGSGRDEVFWMRERWAQVTNEALHEAGVAARVDHRSYKDQGIDREPQARIPREVLYSERSSGKSTPAGDDIRARHRERIEARLKGSEELARVLKRQKAEDRQRAIQSAERKTANKKIPYGALTREQLNERRRELRKANAEQINIKHREWRKRHAEQDSARRWSKLRQEQRPETKPAPELDPAGQNAAVPGRPIPSANADDAVNNWLAYRESKTREESSHGAAHDGGETESRDIEEPGKDTARGRKNDLAL